MDESGINSFVCQEYGWSARGKDVFGEVSGKRFARESFVAAWCNNKIMAPFCYKGTCNTDLFNMWIQDFMLPELKTGQVVILDNATFHKSEKTQQLIQSKGCRVIFLPPYSPDLNPIETFWANLKRKIKSIVSQFHTLQEAIDHAFRLCLFQGE